MDISTLKKKLSAASSVALLVYGAVTSSNVLDELKEAINNLDKYNGNRKLDEIVAEPCSVNSHAARTARSARISGARRKTENTFRKEIGGGGSLELSGLYC
jgi:hypothetical protein